MKSLAAAMLVLWALPATAIAGTRIDAETRRLDRENTRSESATVRVDGRRMRFDAADGRSSLIYRGDRELVWFLDHSERKFVELNRGTVSGISSTMKDANSMLRGSLEGLSPERRAALEGLLDGTLGPPPSALPEVTVSPTGEKDLVAGRVCQEQEVKRGPERLALLCTASQASLGLADDALAVLPELVAFLRQVFESLAGVMPGAVGRDTLEAFSSFDQVEGLPLRVRTYEKGKAVAESVVTDVAQESVDPKRFERPGDYRGGFSFGGPGSPAGGPSPEPAPAP